MASFLFSIPWPGTNSTKIYKQVKKLPSLSGSFFAGQCDTHTLLLSLFLSLTHTHTVTYTLSLFMWLRNRLWCFLQESWYEPLQVASRVANWPVSQYYTSPIFINFIVLKTIGVSNMAWLLGQNTIVDILHSPYLCVTRLNKTIVMDCNLQFHHNSLLVKRLKTDTV